MTTSRHDMRHGRQGGRVVDFYTNAKQAERDEARRRRSARAPLFVDRADAQERARQIGGSVHPVPCSSCWAVLAADQTPAMFPAWFPSPTARASDPVTSHQAAQRAAVTAASDRALVLRIHQQWTSGLTDFELAELADRQQTSLGVRRGELRKAGLIRDSGLRRPAPSGSPATVWIITEAGRQIDTTHPLADLDRGAA